MLRSLVVGIAMVALLLVLLGSLGLVALSITGIVDYLLKPTDYSLGFQLAIVYLAIFSPIAIVSGVALRWVWRRRRVTDR